MTNQQIFDYAQKSLEGGYSIEQIVAALSEQGWNTTEIDGALRKVQEIAKQKSIVSVTPPDPQEKLERNTRNEMRAGKPSMFPLRLLRSLSVSQILLCLGGFIVVPAGMIYAARLFLKLDNNFNLKKEINGKNMATDQLLSLPTGSTQLDVPQQQNPNFTHHISSYGYEIDYPNGWEIQEKKGVDTGIFETKIFPIGNAPHSSESMQQFISVKGALSEMGPLWIETVTQAAIERLVINENKLNQDVVITRTSRTTIDGKAAIVYSYVNSIHDMEGTGIILISWPPIGVMFFPVAFILEYQSKKALYSEETARIVLGSFKEQIFRYMEKMGEVRRQEYINEMNRAINAIGDIDPSYLPTGFAQSGGIGGTKHDGQWVRLDKSYSCEADKFKRPFLTIIRYLPSHVGNDFIRVQVQTMKNLGSSVFDVYINGKSGVLATQNENSLRYRLLWQDDASFLDLTVSPSTTCTINEEELMKIARSIGGR